MAERKRLILTIGAIVLAAALVGGGVALFSGRGAGADGGETGAGVGPGDADAEVATEADDAATAAAQRRENMLTLAQDYIENGEYQRALDLIDEVLIADVSNERAQALKETAIAERRAEAAREEDVDTDAVASLSAEQAEAEARTREAEARAQEAEARRREAELAIQQELAAQRAEEISYANDALQKDDNVWEAHYSLGRVYDET
ncbi:MAG: hypothetical protein PF508_04880, partial [Spirochaeta sp.]|nr:hypothetical protein [Spirochaeta sp.]